MQPHAGLAVGQLFPELALHQPVVQGGGRSGVRRRPLSQTPVAEGQGYSNSSPRTVGTQSVSSWARQALDSEVTEKAQSSARVMGRAEMSNHTTSVLCVRGGCASSGRTASWRRHIEALGPAEPAPPGRSPAADRPL